MLDKLWLLLSLITAVCIIETYILGGAHSPKDPPIIKLLGESATTENGAGLIGWL